MTIAPPLPQRTPESAPFWNGCAQEELRLQRCASGHWWFPPGRQCPECWSADWRWERVSGRGTVFSFVVFQRSYHPAFREALPYAVAVIALAEGPRFLSRVVEIAPDQVRVGMPVAVTFEDVAGTKLPFFRRA